MLLDLTNLLIGADGKEVANGQRLADALSDALSSHPSKLFPILRAWEINKKIKREGKIDLELSDMTTLEKFVEESNLFPMAKGQIIELIVGIIAANKEKKETTKK